MTAETLLAVRDIEVVYQGAIRALRGVSLDVERGQIVAILGSNGAGKTTTLRAISGFIGLDGARVTRGTIAFEGARIENRKPYDCARLGIAIVPEREKIFPNLTVQENLMVPPTRLSAAERRRIENLVFEFFPALAGRRASEAGLLSGGERQMLGVAAKLIMGPQLLLIDELSLGLAPIVVFRLMQQLLKIRQELALSLLLVEQSATLALEVADYVYVLENGMIAHEGDKATMLTKPRIHEFYLGTASESRRSYRDARQERLMRAKHG